MILSTKRITKALIRLRGCAGWSAPVLFATPRRQVFSRRGPNYAVSKHYAGSQVSDRCPLGYLFRSLTVVSYLQETVCPSLMVRASRQETGIMMATVRNVQQSAMEVGGMVMATSVVRRG